jgi:hypothetical protein
MFDLGATMRDGVRLSADVYLPDDETAAPAILVRTPYDNTRPDFVSVARRFTAHGYPFVIQDTRGRGDSDGVFTPWLDDFDDGYDTVAWVAAQDWCNGKVGMLGGSYMAWVQWTAAARKPPHLAAMVTAGSPGRWFRDWPYRFGALWAEDYVEWVNRVSGRSHQSQNLIDWNDLHAHRHPRAMDRTLGRPMPHWQECLDHTTLDEFWQRLAITGYEEMDLPVLHITGWFDGCAPGEFHHYHQMVAHSPAFRDQSLLVGAWGHGGACTTGQAIEGALDLGSEASIDLPAVWLTWFDRWLRDVAGEPMPPVRYFAMGANAWRDADAWPPSDATARSLYLTADGSLTTEAPATPSSRSFAYDPADPTPGMEPLSSEPLADWSPRDLAFLERRSDVLVYTSEQIEAPLEIAGPVHLHVQASSSAVDTDFAAILADVDPDGRSYFVSHGILRAPFRESLSDPAPLVPGERYTLPIEMADLGHVVLPGHRLRLIVSSCLFPYYHPNPNTGASYGDEQDGAYLVASQTIYSDSAHPSRLTFFVRPAAIDSRPAKGSVF